MTSQEFQILILAACGLSWLVTVLPSFLFVVMPSGWLARRIKILQAFTPGALKEYYSLYFPERFPKAQWPNETEATLLLELSKAFKKDFNSNHGRWNFIIPIGILALVSGVGFWGVAESVSVWMNVTHHTYAFPAMVVSAFLGGFTWVVLDQLARRRSGDFTPTDVANATFRFLISIPFGYSLAIVAASTKDNIPTAASVAAAFLIGSFPTDTLFSIGRRLGAKTLNLGDDGGGRINELEALQNVTKTNAQSFQDEGVTTIAQLAWTDPIDLSIRTNLDFNYVVDCMSQSLLAVYVGAEDLKKIAKFSLRGAQEAAGVIDDLEAPGQDADAKKKALASGAWIALTGAAKALGLNPEEMRYTIQCVAQDPYTKFLREIWGNQGDGNEAPEEV